MTYKTIKTIKPHTMNHTLIHTNGYLLIVDGEVTEIGEYCYGLDINKQMETTIHEAGSDDLHCKRHKIIAHLPLNNSPILDGVHLLPPLKQDDEADKLALQEIGGWIENDEDNLLYKGFILGYGKAKEQYKYTYEDMMKMYDIGCKRGATSQRLIFPEPNFHMESKELVNTFIQSLSQPKLPVAFTCEMEFVENTLWGQKSTGIYKNKTVINSQGQTVCVGVYVY